MFLKTITYTWLIIAAFTTVSNANPERWSLEWPETDFTRTTIVEWSEIQSGGPPKDGIPAISHPNFHSIEVDQGISDREPVITVNLSGSVARAYPIRYLVWHEIVNDTLSEIPIVVTFCPLCNSALVFDRRLDHDVLEFGVSGMLRNSDMIMFDRQTESWWQQAIGLGIVGAFSSSQLVQIPSWMESFGEFKAQNPEGLVMAEPNFRRRYGANPYRNYDSSDRPFLYRGELPPHGIHPLMRVVRVGANAWPMERLMANGILTEGNVTLTWEQGQASALDSQNIAEGRDVGSVRVRDKLGRDLPHDVMFAFAFHAFFPDGNWMLGSD